MTEKREIRKAFRELHACEAVYHRTVPIAEVFQGREIWKGDVMVFDLLGHPKAKRGYAWAYPKEGGGKDIVTVLELPPVVSPETAVKVAIASHIKG